MNREFLIDVVITCYLLSDAILRYAFVFLSFLLTRSSKKLASYNLLTKMKMEMNILFPGSADRCNEWQNVYYQQYHPYTLTIVEMIKQVGGKFFNHWSWWQKGGSLPFDVKEGKEEVVDDQTTNDYHMLSKSVVKAVQRLVQSKQKHIESVNDSNVPLRTKAKQLLSDTEIIKVVLFYCIHRLWDLLFGFKWSRELVS